MASFAGIFVWWFFSVLLAVLAWPLTYRLFQWLPDRGLAFSRLVGWLFTGYVAWLLGFAWNSWSTSMAAWIILGLLSWRLFTRRRGEHLEFLKANSGLIFVYELAFFALFFTWSVVRMKHPNIEGQEKFMDFAFLNSMFRSVRLPPMDPWLAGAHNYVNYYYFGYFLNAAFARLTFIGHDIAYNLAVSNDYALCGLAVLGLGYNLTKALWPGLAGVLCLQVFGNLHGALQVLGIQWDQPFSWWEPTRLIKDVSANGHYLNRWWWSASPASLAAAGLGPDATRDGLISEFPSFSFLHGDLHPHLTGLPLTLLVLALGLNLVKNPGAQAVSLSRAFDRRAESLLALIVALGAVFMANTWDLPAYGFLTSALILAQLHASGALGKGAWAKAWLLPSALLLIGLLLAATPFLAFFNNPTKGFGMSGAHTGMRDTLVFWGLFLAVLFPYAVLRLRSLSAGTSAPLVPSSSAAAGKPAKLPVRVCSHCGSKLRPGKDVCGQCGTLHAAPAPAPKEAVTLAPPAWVDAWLLLFTHPSKAVHHPAVKFGAPLLAVLWLACLAMVPTIAVFTGLAALSCLALAARGGDRESLYVAVLVLVGSLLVLATECVYLRDVFEGDPSITRMNTVFKFYFQAWILFSAAVPFALWWTLRSLRAFSMKVNVGYGVLLAVLAVGAMVYPVQAIAFVWDDFDQNARFAPTLDGAAWFQRDYPADFAAVQDLRALPGQPVIAEAVGGAYTHFARVSAYTGFRSVLGWGNHESQWRPSGWPTQTEADVNELFKTADLNRARQLLDEYQVDYVFVGQLERDTYGAGVDKFAQLLGPPVINEMGTLVYKVSRPQ